MNRASRPETTTGLSAWQYSGLIALTKDLSLLEPALATGLLEAARHGCRPGGPDSILVTEVMFLPSRQIYLSIEETCSAGISYAPTHAQFVMTWATTSQPALRAVAEPDRLSASASAVPE